MAGLHHFQRDACERATARRADQKPAVPPPILAALLAGGQIYFSDGSQAYVAGVSTDHGTCTRDERKGEQFLVLSAEPCTPRIIGNAEELICSAALLVRRPTPEEIASDNLAQLGVARRCVEVVELVGVNSDVGTFTFHRTGVAELYTNTAGA